MLRTSPVAGAVHVRAIHGETLRRLAQALGDPDLTTAAVKELLK